MKKASFKIVFSTLLLLIATVAFFLYQANTSGNSKWDPENLTNYTNWYQINWHKQAVGWASESLEVTDSEFVVREKDYIEGRVLGKPIRLEYARELRFSNHEPYTLLAGSISSIEPQLNNAMFFKNKKYLEVSNVRNGLEEKFKLSPLDFKLNDYYALQSWIEAKPSLGDRKEIAVFDDASLSEQVSNVEVAKLLQNKSSDNKGYLVKQTSPKQEPTEVQNWYKFDPDGNSFFIKRLSGMQFVKSSSKVTLNPAMQNDLYLQTAINVDRPLGDIKQIESLVLSLRQGQTGWLKQHKDLEIGAQTITLRAGSQHKVSSSERIAIEQRINKFSSNPQLLKLAQEKTYDYKNTYQKVTALNQFVNSYISYQTTSSALSINDILQLKTGDCTEYSALLHALLESLHIPVREVSGLIYLGDEKQQFGGHVWLEVLIDDYWLGVDPTWNLMDLSSAHIPLSYSEQGILESVDNDLEFSFSVKQIILKESLND